MSSPTRPNEVVDIAAKLALVTDHWSPKVVARLNDYEIKVVKVKGEFVWHSHEDTDELFLVVDRIRRSCGSAPTAAAWSTDADE